MIINNGKAKSIQEWAETEFVQHNYRIAIPTYKRTKILKEKTLKTLIAGKINPKRIDIFVADTEEAEEYRKTLDEKTYSKIIIGEKGRKNICNFIHSYYPEGTEIISCDDDIEAIHQYIDEKHSKELENINEFFCYAFQVGEELKNRFWGVYPVDNPYFMKNRIGLGLRFINGTLFGSINSYDKDTFIVLEDKGDFERTLREYRKNGSVMRFDFISYKSKEFTLEGGMQYDGQRTDERKKYSRDMLVKMFPKLCKINNAHKGRYEVKLVEQREEYKILANMQIKVKQND